MQKPLRVAINGLGRIGRMFLRIAWGNPAIEIVGANSPSDPAAYAHLLKYDSLYGIWLRPSAAPESEGGQREVLYADGRIRIDGKSFPVSQVTEREKLPWREYAPDIVLDASGKYRKRSDAAMHLEAGAARTVVTAPMDDPDATLVAGINDQSFDPSSHLVISAASCTSVATAFTLAALRPLGIRHAYLTTVHAVTGDQNLNDGAHKDLRRARAATESIIPTSTGVTETVGTLFPDLAGKVSGISLRVPVTVPSLLCVAAEFEHDVTADGINAAFRTAAAGPLAGHLAVSDLPLVSVDFKQNPHGAIADLLSTAVVDGRLANTLSWYDNEWGYTFQVVKLLEKIAQRL